MSSIAIACKVLFFIVHMCVDCVHTSAGALRVQRWASDSFRAGVTGSCEVPGMVDGNLGLVQDLSSLSSLSKAFLCPKTLFIQTSSSPKDYGDENDLLDGWKR